MADEARWGVGRFFVDVVPDEFIAAYEKLHAAGGVPKDEAAEFLGSPDLVKELVDRGMARIVPHTPRAPASLQVVAPGLALLALIHRRQIDAAGELKVTLSAYDRLRDAHSIPEPGDAGDRDHLVRIITDGDKILEYSLNLVNYARRDFMTLNTLESAMPLTEDFPVTPPPSLRGQIRVRGIYDQASVRHPVAAMNMRRCIEEGEEARILPVVPMKMELADETVALLPLNPDGTGGALLVFATPILRGLRSLFEMKWEAAAPAGGGAPPPACPLSEKQHEVLQYLAQGMLDKEIASRLGVSDSTVHRYVTGILDCLKVRNRFAAGIIAERRGWLTGREARNG